MTTPPIHQTISPNSTQIQAPPPTPNNYPALSDPSFEESWDAFASGL